MLESDTYFPTYSLTLKSTHAIVKPKQKHDHSLHEHDRQGDVNMFNWVNEDRAERHDACLH